MKKLIIVALLSILGLDTYSQTISSTYFYDDFSTPLSSEVSYSTLYPLYYTSLTRNTTDQRYELVVDPKVGEWRPVVIGLGNTNGGDGIDISTYPIMKITVQVPSTSDIPSNSNLKLAFYLSDNVSLGEYDFITDEDYLEPSIQTGTEVTLTYNWLNAKQVTNWAVWPPATGCASPDLKHIKNIGFSINTNSTAAGTYYIKSIEIGTQSILPLVEFSNPTCGTSYNNGDLITLTATQSYTESSIDSVRFFNNGTLLTTIKTTPFTYDWSNASVGDHAVKAIAYYHDLVSSESQATRLKVNQVTGIKDKIQESYQFYPNPSSKNITFTIEVKFAKILNLQGTLLMEETNVSELNIESLEKGMYMIITEYGYSKLMVK